MFRWCCIFTTLCSSKPSLRGHASMFSETSVSQLKRSCVHFSLQETQNAPYTRDSYTLPSSGEVKRKGKRQWLQLLKIRIIKVMRIEEGQNKKRMQTLIGGRRHKFYFEASSGKVMLYWFPFWLLNHQVSMRLHEFHLWITRAQLMTPYSQNLHNDLYT